VPVGDGVGQTSERQLDALADLGAALSEALGLAVESLWTMRNGYALCTRAGLDAITNHLASLTSEQTDSLRSMLRIGVHSDVDVTDADGAQVPVVSQAFCSALPVAYSRVPSVHWQAFASLVLESAYEATLWAAARNAQRGATNLVLLTRLGGGAFGNDDDWIHGAIRRAIRNTAKLALDVRLVSYGQPSRAMLQLSGEFA
jgi:hypothetical protein